MIITHVVHVATCDICGSEEPMLDRDGTPFYFESRAEAQTFLEVGVHDWLLDEQGRLACNRCWVFHDATFERVVPGVWTTQNMMRGLGHGAPASA